MTDWLSHRARVSPHRPALVFEAQTWSYRDLDRDVTRLAGQLTSAGVTAGRHVAVLLPNRPEFVLLFHALARLRAVLVPLNLRLTVDELSRQVTQANCDLLLYSDETADSAERLPLQGLPLRTLAARPLPDTVPVLPPFDQSATQAILYTSGTTGRPKGAMLTYNNHFYSAVASSFRLGTAAAARWLVSLPLYHVGGQAIILRACLYGTTVVLLSGFKPEDIALALAKHEVTLVSVVPTVLHRLVNNYAPQIKTPHLRTILVGGAALSAPLAQQCATFELPVVTTYGLTEAASQVATATVTGTAAKPGSVGKPLMFTTVRVADSRGHSLPAGEVGELVVGGPTVMIGYYRRPEATARALRGGELFTGDLGYLDEDGDLWLVERREDLIVSGGENVYPAEVEAVLRGHPALDEVCVVGLPHPEWGQQVTVAVTLRPEAAPEAITTATLMEFARPHLAGYKLPRRVVLLPTLPQTASGKIRRNAVRRILLEGE
jgi:O-succinylbenzoic acid--CoA ligase